jgi:16S rRNA (cytidine1402-2'-O)-methyltransferase
VIASRVASALERVEAGERVAFVSDAGMPGVSDPGQRLVDAALDAGLPVEVVPGPSAVTCAVVASGLACEHFFFEGFLPRRHSAQVARLGELAQVPGAIVCYESPHRVAATLASVAEVIARAPRGLGARAHQAARGGRARRGRGACRPDSRA